MQLYAITNRRLLPTDARDHAGLVALAGQWASAGVDFIQIREKDLGPEELRELTRAIVSAVRRKSARTRVLLNGPAEIAVEAGADGIHLPADVDPSAAAEARVLFDRSRRETLVSHACHSVGEVLKVREELQRDPRATLANTLILYAPVFEKITSDGRVPGQGLDALRAAVEAAGGIPVFALGGITLQNAPACLAAGAAGIAGIRLFLENAWVR